MSANVQTNPSEKISPPAYLGGDQWHERLSDGTTVLIRSIREEDIDLERRFIEELSPESRRFRFLGQMNAPSAALLKQMTQLDPSRDVAFVALIAEGALKREIGVARFSTDQSGNACECAVAVADAWHHRGLATLLMQHLINVARSRGIASMSSIDAVDNSGIKDLAARLGFSRVSDPQDPHQVIHTLELKA